MKRIILDTSAYGEIVVDLDVVKIIRYLDEHRILLFYGNKIIRDELRKTPKGKKLGNRKLRILLLELYDGLISKEKRNLKITELVDLIAEKYYNSYKEFKGNRSHKDIINDLKIVACASLHNLDIVVSHDEKSMLSDKAIRAYKKVNKDFELNNPDFKTYNKFKEEIKHYWRSH